MGYERWVGSGTRNGLEGVESWVRRGRGVSNNLVGVEGRDRRGRLKGVETREVG